MPAILFVVKNPDTLMKSPPARTTGSKRDRIQRFGVPGGTRTPDLLLRRQLLYPVELRAPEGESRKIGRGGGIRTHDPLLPKQMRYQAALRPDTRDGILAPAGKPHQIKSLSFRNKESLPTGRLHDI